MAAAQRVDAPAQWRRVRVPRGKPIVSTAAYRPGHGPPAECERSVAATVTCDGEFLPDRPGDPKSSMLREHYDALCARERTLPLTALSAFQRVDVPDPAAGLDELRFSFPLPPRYFEETDLTPSAGAMFELNAMAMRKIASVCRKTSAVTHGGLCEFLESQDGFTHVLLNASSHCACVGRDRPPSEMEGDAWRIHPSLQSPTLEFVLRAPPAQPRKQASRLCAAVDWMVPDDTAYLVDGSGMRLLLGPRRVYCQDSWLVIVERCSLEVDPGTRGTKIRLRKGRQRAYAR